MNTASKEELSNSYARFRFRTMTPSNPPESSRFNTMSNKNVHPINGRFMHLESQDLTLSKTHTKGVQTMKTVDDEVKHMKADFYQEGDFQDRVSLECYQEEGKAERHKHTGAITLLGSFIVMFLISFVASCLFPTPTREQPTTTLSEDITPILTPMQMMGFN